MPVENSKLPGQDATVDLKEGTTEERMKAEITKALDEDPEIRAMIRALARGKNR